MRLPNELAVSVDGEGEWRERDGYLGREDEDGCAEYDDREARDGESGILASDRRCGSSRAESGEDMPCRRHGQRRQSAVCEMIDIQRDETHRSGQKLGRQRRSPLTATGRPLSGARIVVALAWRPLRAFSEQSVDFLC